MPAPFLENEFSSAFSPAFDYETPPIPQKMLVFDGSVDDHPRPRLPLWSRFHYPETQIALLLYEDGRVIETDTLFRQEYLDADDVAAGGHTSIYHLDSWQVGVLEAAGYTLVDVYGMEAAAR